MAEPVYLLCAITSIVCAALLFRGYRANRTNLLFWSSLCFMGLALNNVLLFVDLVMMPNIDMRLWRGASALTAVLVLLIGLIME
jgi:hypothetical protein